MLSAGDTFLRVPTCLLITTETALSSSLRDFVIRNHRQLAPIEVLTLFLMNEKLRGHDSEWRFFINSLPTTYTTPVYLGSRLLAKLPCDMFRRAQTQVSRIRSTFLKLRTLLTKENGDGNSPLSSLSENFTWCLFVWAWTAVNTRCIFSEHKTGHSLWDDDKCALAPFLDCLNHHWKASVSHTEYDHPFFKEIFCNAPLLMSCFSKLYSTNTSILAIYKSSLKTVFR